MDDFGNRVKTWWKTKVDLPVVLLFLVNLVLVFAFFLPNFSEINPWDEAAYLHAGSKFVETGQLPDLAGNPLTSVFFALTYLPFRGSTFWMVHSVSLARLILFTLLWLSTYLVAKQLSDLSPPIVALGMLFVTPLSLEFLRFPSDPLFASLAGVSLWQLLLYKDSGSNSHLLRSSLFMAFAALARADGLVLFATLVFLVILLRLRKRDLLRSMVTVLLPFAVLVGGYALLFGLLTGDFNTGLMQRTYDNFESGQQLIFSNQGEFSGVIESRLEASRLFGTAEENQYSVFKAILQNPKEYLKRLTAITKKLPQLVLQAYGIRFGVLLFILAGRGLFELYKRREYALLTILCLWPAHLATGFIITLFRIGHLQFHFYVVFLLSSIGLFALLSNLKSRIELAWISILMSALCIYAIADNKLAIFYGAGVFLGVLWVIKFLHYDTERPVKVSGLLVVLLAGIILRGSFPSPKIRTLGSDPKEQAIQFLVDNFSPRTTIAAASPGVIWAAQMGYAGFSSWDVPKDKTSMEFIDWLQDQGVKAIYVDHELYNGLPGIWKLIEPQIGGSLARVFQVEQGNYQVLIFNP